MPNGFITTYSGRRLYPANPTADSISIADIAIGLSREARYAGHTRTVRAYTVAEHSVRCRRLADDDIALFVLMHDATEFALKDCPKPIKDMLPAYQELEEKLNLVIAEKYGYLSQVMDENVAERLHHIDMTMAATEMRDFKGESYPHLPPPLTEKLGEPWTENQAREEFLREFYKLWPRTAQKSAAIKVALGADGSVVDS